MSERIGIVCEGLTDFYIISGVAALFFPYATFNLIQPDSSLNNNLGVHGGGWTGVLKWCRQFGKQPIMQDLLIFHLDADVVQKNYGDGNFRQQDVESYPLLPFACSCPPASNAADYLTLCLKAWLGKEHLPQNWIMCIPSRAIEAWVIAGKNLVLSRGQDLECLDNPKIRLQQSPWQHRLRNSSEYRKFAQSIDDSMWREIRSKCSQAEAFHQSISSICS